MQRYRQGLEIDSLPPEGARLITPDDPDFVKIPTPTDDRDLIDVPELIRTVLATVDPDYLWPDAHSIHHFYWPMVNYPYIRTENMDPNPAVFRSLPLHKGLLPRTFENWLHKITAPPPVPSPEVMRYRIEAWYVARSLFGNVQQSIRWQRLAERRAQYVRANPEVLGEEFDPNDDIAQAMIQEILVRYFKGEGHSRSRLESIPPEHRLFDPTEPRHILAKQLGKLVVPRQLRPQIKTAAVLSQAA